MKQMEDIQSVLGRVMTGMSEQTSPQIRLAQNWEKIAGEKIAKISRAFVSKKNILYVEVIDGAYAFEIRQKYQTSLLKRAQALLGEAAVIDIRIIVKP